MEISQNRYVNKRLKLRAHIQGVVTHRSVPKEITGELRNPVFCINDAGLEYCVPFNMKVS